MADLWEAEFDKRVEEVLPAWAQASASLKTRAHDLVHKWATGDRQDLANAIAAAIQDHQVTEPEILSLLARLVAEFGDQEILGSGVLAALLLRLQTSGTLTPRDLAEVAAGWAATRTKDANLQHLLETAASGTNLNTETILQALLAWLRRQGAPELAQRLDQQLHDPSSPLTFRRLLPLLTGYLVRSGKIRNPGVTITTWEQSIAAAFRTLDDDPLRSVLQSLVEGDHVDAAKKLLHRLGITADELVIRAVLQGQTEPLVLHELQDFLSSHIPGIKQDQVEALAQTIVDLFSGRRELIAKETERDRLAGMGLPITPQEYDDIWLPTRQMLYAAQLACAGGALVPTEAMARPHVFGAAALQADTPIKSLAKKEQWPLLAECIRLFTREEFKSAPNGGHWNTETPATLEAIQNAGIMMADVFNTIRVVIES